MIILSGAGLIYGFATVAAVCVVITVVSFFA
jgi:hypothetical protein